MSERKGPRTISWKASSLVLGALALLIGGGFVGAQAVHNFRPPSVAVVDISKVFESYRKRQDRQDELEAKTRELQQRLNELERKYKEVVAELPQLEPGEKRKDLMMKKLQLEMDVKLLKEDELGRLRKMQIGFITEIREEITQEIDAYVQAQQLDLVLEKTVTAEGEKPGTGFRWPIVHYVAPELDITRDIAERLNSRYEKSR